MDIKTHFISCLCPFLDGCFPGNSAAKGEEVGG